MGMEMRQELRLSQQLVMTPQLQQAIKLLQLSRMELVDMVHEEMLENPILEDDFEVAAEQGKEREIIIARNGRPAAKLVPIDSVPAGNRLGVAKGLFQVPDSIDLHNDEVARLFADGEMP